MKARRPELDVPQMERILNYESEVDGIRKDTEVVRFSKKDLEQLGVGFSRQGGGLVRIRGQVYTFEENPDNEDKSHVLGDGTSGKVKSLQKVNLKGQENQDETSDDELVLKVISTLDEKAVKDFRKECEIAEKLERGFSSVFKKTGETEIKGTKLIRDKEGELVDTEEYKGPHISYCAVLKRAKGKSLNNFIGDKTIDAAERLRIIDGCFSEIKLMQDNGLMHNDVKPDNFMYDRGSGAVQVIDFGSALHINDDLRSSEVQKLGGLGTAGYIAPEVDPSRPLDGGMRDFTFKNDVYALGKSAKALFGLDWQEKYAAFLASQAELSNVYEQVKAGRALPDALELALANNQFHANNYAVAYNAYQTFLTLDKITQDNLTTLITEMTFEDSAKRCSLDTAIAKLAHIRGPEVSKSNTNEKLSSAEEQHRENSASTQEIFNKFYPNKNEAVEILGSSLNKSEKEDPYESKAKTTFKKIESASIENNNEILNDTKNRHP